MGVDRRYKEGRGAYNKPEGLKERLLMQARNQARNLKAYNDDGFALQEAGYGVGGTGGIRRSKSIDPSGAAKVSARRGSKRREMGEIFRTEGSGAYKGSTSLRSSQTLI